MRQVNDALALVGAVCVDAGSGDTFMPLLVELIEDLDPQRAAEELAALLFVVCRNSAELVGDLERSSGVSAAAILNRLAMP